MSSIKRRLGMLAVTAGIGLAAVAGTGAAAHASTPAHHFQPTFTFHDDDGHVSHITGFAVTMYANYFYEWHYAQCFAQPNALFELIDTYLEATTDDANNLIIKRYTTAGKGVNACADQIATGSTSSGGWFIHSDGTADSYTAPGTPGNYTFNSPSNRISAAYGSYPGFTQAAVESQWWVDSVY